MPTLNLVVKADVQGSTEALRDSLTRLSTDSIKINVIASGVGGMLLDLQLALMVEQAIDDMRRLASVGGDDLVVKWGIAV